MSAALVEASTRAGAVGGVSVRGASHVRGNLPNQDAVAHAAEDGWFYLAVADGHGAAPHYRSDRGAAFAVEIVLDLLRRSVADLSVHDPARLVSSLPGSLVERWRERVEADIRAAPVRERPGFESHAVYGTTCLAAAIGPGLAIFVQIGDGDLLASCPSGLVDRAIPADPALAGPATYSLCQPDAADRVHVRLFADPHPLSRPDFVMAVTDGLANSYRTDSDFLLVIRHLRDTLRTIALDPFLADLAPWLTQCSSLGSRDDVSVALFSQPDPGRGSLP